MTNPHDMTAEEVVKYLLKPNTIHSFEIGVQMVNAQREAAVREYMLAILHNSQPIPGEAEKDLQIAALIAERDRLREALKGLSSEINLAYIDTIQEDWGNTNASVIQHWKGKAEEALQSSPHVEQQAAVYQAALELAEIANDWSYEGIPCVVDNEVRLHEAVEIYMQAKAALENSKTVEFDPIKTEGEAVMGKGAGE